MVLNKELYLYDSLESSKKNKKKNLFVLKNSLTNYVLKYFLKFIDKIKAKGNILKLNSNILETKLIILSYIYA